MSGFLENIQVHKKDPQNKGQKYLSFSLCNEKYAFEIQFVQEILVMQSITRIPTAPDFIVGIINLRGHILPVLDPKPIIGLEKKELSSKDYIILTKITIQEEEHTWGILVEKVSDVIFLSHDEIDHSYIGKEDANQNFIQGVAKKNDQILILLNPQTLIPKEIVQNYKQEKSEV
jgi:purine-binding chemotaxis protein CheW